MFSDEFIFLPENTLRVSSDHPEQACHSARPRSDREAPQHASVQQHVFFETGSAVVLPGSGSAVWSVGLLVWAKADRETVL